MTEARFENATTVIRHWDDIFKALSAEPRRQIVVSLLDTSSDQSVSLPEGAINPNVPPDLDAFTTELHHVHLPMLADLGYIDWEPDPLVARRGQAFEEVASVVAALHTQAPELPDSLVIGCQRLEWERQMPSNE